ncbi:mitochondrial solute carrier family 25 member 33/36 [Andalucia godoyi]|uniref:Mitochondrial solute carrier family 25 member 33/36 n=1 Tax=Andalucia godoyi TaxID=505711 RepID=A0A8K0AJV9_ANDGO|nr:mitochondrial solute carrier family 25 member 33/36 [Andalucia godoyi]|eukprot:ANDGO_05927.mRNA.1 mitochondrial solute carrier family 25 member 33/36
MSAVAQDSRDRVVTFVGGGLGGAVGAFMTNPLDVVRTRFQARVKSDVTQLAQTYRFATLHAVRLIAKTEGVPGLFRGLTPNLVGIVPSRSIYFATYSSTKGFLLQHYQKKENWITHALSACTASIVTSTAVNPIWVIKVRLQLQSTNSQLFGSGSQGQMYNGYLDAFSRIFREEGFRAFYKGLGASMLGISETVIQFLMYEKMRALVKERRDPTPVDNLFVGGLSKFCASSITYPHEVLRTRMREQRTHAGSLVKPMGLLQMSSFILKEEGLAAFYGGFGPHMLRVVPNTAIIFAVFELVVRVFGSSTMRDAR